MINLKGADIMDNRNVYGLSKQERRLYTNVHTTVKAMVDQTFNGMAYANDRCPRFSSGEKVFKWLKPQLTYVEDPPGIELIQNLYSLLENNYWGESGWGDCDCFSVATATLCYISGAATFFTLAGNENWSHVFVTAYFGSQAPIQLDLTAPYPNAPQNRYTKFMDFQVL